MTEASTYSNFLDGKWVAPSTGEYYPDVNPADTGDVIGHFPLSSTQDADAAVSAAHRAFGTWSRLLPQERCGYVRRFVDLLARNTQRIGQALCREEGKTLKEAVGEPARGVVECEYFLGEGQRLEGITMPSDRKGVTSVATRVPIGVVAAISPWNFPFLTPLRKIIPALVTGNTVVFKPAYDTPHCGVLLMELFEEAGLPPGVVNMVMGKGSRIGDAICGNPMVRGITFTGSTSVGRRINTMAAPNFTRVQLEMGGKNPCIVADCHDLDRAAKDIAAAAYAVTGQRCTSISRVIALSKHAEELEARIARKAGEYVLGNGKDAGVTMGPVINAGAGEAILGYIEGARRVGARVVLGGGRRVGGDYDKGFYVEPTLIADVRPTMRVAVEEVFGPVLAFLRVDTFDEALEIANDSEYGLAASLFSDNLEYIGRFQREIETGMTHVNHGTVTDGCMPFGGTKNSGLGPFSKGATNKDLYTTYRVSYVQYQR
jgi:aldehyde dehydrogenase (NAD+)